MITAKLRHHLALRGVTITNDFMRRYHEDAHVYALTNIVSADAHTLDAIDALHQRAPSPDNDWCNECSIIWPCLTARLLHPEAVDSESTL
jgi:hypothetical protein